MSTCTLAGAGRMTVALCREYRAKASPSCQDCTAVSIYGGPQTSPWVPPHEREEIQSTPFHKTGSLG